MRMVAIGLGILGLMACQEYDVKGVPDDTDLPPDDTDLPPDDTDVPPGPAIPDIQLDPVSIDFGVLPSECPTDPQIVTISNVGTADLQVNEVFFASSMAEFSQSGAATVLAPGDSTQFSVEFMPNSVGVFDNEVLVASNDPDESVAGVPVTGEGVQGPTVVEGFSQVGSSLPVDILFVIDNSESMADDNNALRNNFGQFMNGFLTLGLDYQIGVVTTDMEDPTQSGRIQGPIITTSTPDPVAQFQSNTDVGTGGSINEMGLQAAYEGLSAPLIDNENLGLVRPGSLLSVIIISDEGDSSAVSAGTMINFLDNYQGDPNLSSLSIVGGPRNGILPCWRGIFPAAPVPKYWNVANSTGGIHANICQLDMSAILQQLAVVAAGLEDSYALVNLPDDPSQIEVLVDGVVLTNDPDNGWTYDPGTNTIDFNGTAIPQAGSDVVVQFPGSGTCP